VPRFDERTKRWLSTFLGTRPSRSLAAKSKISAVAAKTVSGAAVSISSALTPTSAPAESLTSAPTCSQCALLLTLLWRDWIELVFRVDPDAGSGALEWAFAAVALGVAAASGAVAHRDRPGPHEPVEQP
jgi:hypothetical protein